MDIASEFYEMLLQRTTWHLIAAIAIGACLAWKSKLYIIPLVLIALKEIFLDPHPTEEYWIKSIFDFGAWAFGIASGYFIYRSIIEK